MNNHDRNMMQLWPHAVRRPIESNVKKKFFFSILHTNSFKLVPNMGGDSHFDTLIPPGLSQS